MPNFISEDQIEQAPLQHQHGFDVLEYDTADADDLNDGSALSGHPPYQRLRLLPAQGITTY